MINSLRKIKLNPTTASLFDFTTWRVFCFPPVCEQLSFFTKSFLISLVVFEINGKKKKPGNIYTTTDFRYFRFWFVCNSAKKIKVDTQNIQRILNIVPFRPPVRFPNYSGNYSRLLLSSLTTRVLRFFVKCSKLEHEAGQMQKRFIVCAYKILMKITELSIRTNAISYRCFAVGRITICISRSLSSVIGFPIGRLIS